MENALAAWGAAAGTAGAIVAYLSYRNAKGSEARELWQAFFACNPHLKWHWRRRNVALFWLCLLGIFLLVGLPVGYWYGFQAEGSGRAWLVVTGVVSASLAIAALHRELTHLAHHQGLLNTLVVHFTGFGSFTGFGPTTEHPILNPVSRPLIPFILSICFPLLGSVILPTGMNSGNEELQVMGVWLLCCSGLLLRDCWRDGTDLQGPPYLRPPGEPDNAS